MRLKLTNRKYMTHKTVPPLRQDLLSKKMAAGKKERMMEREERR